MAASDAGRLPALRADASARPRHPGAPARAHRGAPARRAPAGGADPLLLRRRRRRDRGRRAHDAVRDPRPERSACSSPCSRSPATRCATWCARRERRPVMIAGVVGPTAQAVRGGGAGGVARLRRGAAEPRAPFGTPTTDVVLDHCARVADVIPVVGFYLQPAVGGRVLDRAFWRGFFDIDRVVAIKVAPFDRYRTLDVANALAESGRTDVALYTGNDDAIVADLLTPFPPAGDGQRRCASRVACSASGRSGRAQRSSPAALPRRTGWRVTAQRGCAAAPGARRRAHRRQCRAVRSGAQFAGCIPGIHEVLRRQGLLAGRWCLDPHEELSPGQMEEIDRVLSKYPHLTDDAFVAERRDLWLR